MEQDQPKKSKMAGGFFIAGGMLGGAIVGISYGQPSAGMVAGLLLGVAVALLVWLMDRSRGN